MRLFIAEKPSLARAIAQVLPKPHKNCDGYIQCGNNDVVSWCIGHLLEQAEPDVYNQNYKFWRLEHLPIIPDKWQYQVKKNTAKQFNVLKKLITKADEIVHAGDPDREGQLLVDEVFSYLNLSKEKKLNIKRCLINDLNLPAVAQAVNNLQKNTDFIPLCVSALARARADWLFGINLTRAYTLYGKMAGFNSVLSVGRVQTPILALICERDNEIKNFKPKNFYEVMAHLSSSDKQIKDFFKAKWQPSEACEPYQDEEGRVLSKQLAELVSLKITEQSALVTSFKEREEQEKPPLPYSLSALQIEATRFAKMSAQQVLDICQNLYEKHKLITYPRSDCRYLPKAHFTNREKTFNAISTHLQQYQNVPKEVNPNIQSRCFNDKEVGAHHAIIPTMKSTSVHLTDDEKTIYFLIARQYLMQFCDNAKYATRTIELEIAKGVFKARSKVLVEAGFKALLGKDETDVSSEFLPKVCKGQKLFCQKGEVVEKQTTPPLHFSDATLLSAMTNIARFVKDPSLKKTFRETDGLGTEATRASIIQLLFDRDFIEKKGRTICATVAGQALYDALPDAVKKPDITALWEQDLNKMVKDSKIYHSFMNKLISELPLFLQSPNLEALKRLPKNLERNNKKTFKKTTFKTKK